MLTLVLQRIAFSLFTLLIVSVVVFFTAEALPGDYVTAYLGREATEKKLAELRLV